MEGTHSKIAQQSAVAKPVREVILVCLRILRAKIVYGDKAADVQMECEGARYPGVSFEGTRARAPAPHELGSGLGDFWGGCLAGGLGLLRAQVVLGQSFFQELQTFLWRIGHLEQFEVWW